MFEDAHPVVGDTLYGAPSSILLPGSRAPIPTLERNFLHAASLEFTHPRSEQPMQFRCELPLALSEFLAQLRIRDLPIEYSRTK